MQVPAPEGWIDAVSANTLGVAWVSLSRDPTVRGVLLAALPPCVLPQPCAARRVLVCNPPTPDGLPSCTRSFEKALRLHRCERWAGFQGAGLLQRRHRSRTAGKCGGVPRGLPNLASGMPPLLVAASAPAGHCPSLPCMRSFLRQLPPEQAISLEFWRCSRSLHGTARMYASLAQHRGQGTRILQLRFEALQTDFNATAGALLAAIAERVPGLSAPALLEAAQRCNPAAWSAQQRQANAAHVTAGGDAELRARLQAALWRDGAIRRRLCRLTAALEYPLPPECSSDAAPAVPTSATSSAQL